MSGDILGEDLFSVVVSEIRNYDGKDPLRPWIHGIKKLQKKLPPEVLREKLPRFLQKCVQNFQSETRYHNDSRYVGVWIKLMDFVDEPKSLLRMMEKSRIGTKRAAFYMAYSIYYEKKKQFEEADKMYHLGVKNLAEPVDELQKAYEQFLQRMEQYKRRKQKLKEAKAKMGTQLSDQLQDNSCRNNILLGTREEKNILENQDNEVPDTKRKNFPSEDTVVVKFVGSAIVGRSAAENACHHGLVDPTINLKEAMNAISDMFREPLDLDSKAKQKSHRVNYAKQLGSKNIEVFVDDAFEYQQNQNCETSATGAGSEANNACHYGLMDPTINMKEAMNVISNMFREPLDLDSKLKKESSRSNSEKKQPLGSNSEGFVNGAGHQKNQKRVTDEVAGRSVVENVCHHGLVDPTINMKEAMDAASVMFREPIELNSKLKRKPHTINSLASQLGDSNLEVFVDDDPANQEDCTRETNTSQNKNFVGSLDNCGILSHIQSKNHFHDERLNPSWESFKILADDDAGGFSDSQHQGPKETRKNHVTQDQGPKETIKNHALTRLGDANCSRNGKPKEDTMIRRFFDSYGIDGPDVENVCHHGLVDPTINLKEAMDDINGMFGEPINFVRPRRTRREDKSPPEKSDSQGFLIFTDEDTGEPHEDEPSLVSSVKSDVGNDLFEPTVFTKEALDDINAMFGKPLNF